MKLWHSFIKELQLSSKSYYFYIEIAMAVIFLVILLFVIPNEFTGYDDEYLSLDMPEVVRAYVYEDILEEDLDGMVEVAILKLNGEEVLTDLFVTEDKNLYVLPDRETMIELSKADRPLVGAHLTWNPETERIDYDYYLQGYESERLRNLYTVFHIEEMDVIDELLDEQTVKVLGTDDGLNDKENVVPSILTFNGSMMGMFIISAFIFLDRKEGILKAYAITASRVWHYLMSKVFVLLLVSTVTSLLIIAPVMKLRPNYLVLIVLLLTSGFFFSSVGLLFASFFKTMLQSFGAVYVAMIVVLLPNIAYFVPSWDPMWIRIIPTYPLLQGFKESIIEQGDITYVILASVGFILAGTVVFLVTNYRYKKILAV